MLEIYNEKIRDLLNTNPKTNNDLQVRTTPKGTYVQGAMAVAVGSFAEIDKTMELGTASRTVAATQMNATSSRAHTVMTITVAQVRASWALRPHERLVSSREPCSNESSPRRRSWPPTCAQAVLQRRSLLSHTHTLLLQL